MPHSETNFWTGMALFDPFVDKVPPHLPSTLTAIAVRSAAILDGQSFKRLEAAAEATEALIEEYFDTGRRAVISRILESGSWELRYLSEDRRNAEGLSDLLDNWPADTNDPPPAFPSSENTSDFRALVTCIDAALLNQRSGNQDWGEAHYFAVLALRKVADCIARLTPRKDSAHELEIAAEQLMRSITGQASWPGRWSEQYALEDLVEAMEAICWAERQSDCNALARADGRSVADKADVDRQLHQRVQEAVKKQRSSMARNGTDALHRENRQMKDMVWRWCDEHMTDYPSMDRAAEALTHEIKLVPMRLRTVREWMTQWRRQQRSAGRP